jgi:hypothetical protein
MKRINNYQKFRDEQLNEEFLGSLLSAAKGAFKNFLTGLAAPFKSIKDDFKKGLKREELKKKVTAMLDNLLKTTTDSMNKAEDEGALNSIKDQFNKEFDEKCVEIDKEIQSVKESNGNLILEGAIKDGMIAGRVMLGMVKQKAAEIKMDFDKKVAAAKDLAGKKAARIAEVKAIVDDFKKKVTDDKYLDEQIAKYKEENKIKGDGTGDYKVGDRVLIKGNEWEKNKGEEAWNALSDDEKTKPEEGELKELIDNETIRVGKITKLSTDKVIFDDENPELKMKRFDRPIESILGKVEGDETSAYKAGDSVMYKRDNWEKNKAEEVWNKLTDDEKKKPNDGKLKELIDNGSIGIKVIKAVEKDFVRFTDVDWIKDNDELLGKVDAKAPGQEDLVKKLGELKAKKPDDIKKVSSYVDFISKDENKAKVEEIDKIINKE